MAGFRTYIFAHFDMSNGRTLYLQLRQLGIPISALICEHHSYHLRSLPLSRCTKDVFILR